MRHDMLGMALDDLAPEAYLNEAIEWAKSGGSAYACVSNVHMCILAHDDPAFREVVNGADIVIPDSVILQKARSLLYGVPKLPTMKGADIMFTLCQMAAKADVPIAIIGGRDDATLNLLTTRLRADIPDLEIAYSFSPPFRAATEAEDAELLQSLSTSGARLIFVGLGCPKQERWMYARKGKVTGMMLGVGAAFDFIAGVVKPSPPWVHKAGLEWLYRLASEPGRLWKRYLSTSPRFVALLLLEMLKRKGKKV